MLIPNTVNLIHINCVLYEYLIEDTFNVGPFITNELDWFKS